MICNDKLIEFIQNFQEEISRESDYFVCPSEIIDALDWIIVNLDKLEMEAMKPDVVDWSEEFDGGLLDDRCPMCDNSVHPIENYCSYCGQKLDWDYEEDYYKEELLEMKNQINELKEQLKLLSDEFEGETNEQ